MASMALLPMITNVLRAIRDYFERDEYAPPIMNGLACFMMAAEKAAPMLIILYRWWRRLARHFKNQATVRCLQIRQAR